MLMKLTPDGHGDDVTGRTNLDQVFFLFNTQITPIAVKIHMTSLIYLKNYNATHSLMILFDDFGI